MPVAPTTRPTGYADFLREVKTQVRQRQLQALRAVNSELLALYWWLGDNISQRQAALGWGKAVVETLAKDLQAEFPGRNGFSARNLWNMLEFYRDYATKPKLQPLVAEISWSKNLLIMARCKDDLEREFYLRATARFGWTKNVLQHQLDNHSYRQYLLGQTNFDAAVPHSIKAQAMLAVKDHHTFDFVGLAEQHSEEGEHPPIGIVICRSKTKTMVEYALRTATRALGIATYTVTTQLHVSYQADLPRPEQIAARLQGWVGSEV
ncbi:MAG: hypothetical protein RLZZ591_2748 [Pseudomonadota bacterium]